MHVRPTESRRPASPNNSEYKARRGPAGICENRKHEASVKAAPNPRISWNCLETSILRAVADSPVNDCHCGTLISSNLRLSDVHQARTFRGAMLARREVPANKEAPAATRKKFLRVPSFMFTSTVVN